MGETIINSNQLRASGDTSTQTLIGANQVRQSGDSSSQTLLNKNQIASGGGTVGTPVDYVRDMYSDGTIINYMTKKNGKIWYRAGADRKNIYYSTKIDLSDESSKAVHSQSTTIIYGNNINIGVYWTNTPKTTLDIYDNDMNYIRTIEKDFRFGSDNVSGNLDYLVYGGYIYILSQGNIVKIQDDVSVNDCSNLISIGDNAFVFGDIEGNEALVTFNPNAGNSGSGYYVAKLNLDTMVVGTHSSSMYKTYSTFKATSCAKFNDKYYIAVEGQLYSSTDLSTFTQESYNKVYYRIFPYGDVCYTVAKDGIYKTTDFVTYELWIATTQMTKNEVAMFRTAKAFDDVLMFCYSTAFKTEFVLAPIE